MKGPRKNGKKGGEDRSDEEDGNLHGGVRVQRTMMTEEELNDVKPISQFHKVGDLAQREKAPKIRGTGAQDSAAETRLFPGGAHQSSGPYAPLTKESKQAYEEIANIINRAVPDQPGSFVADCASEVIGIYKNRELVEAEKRSQVAKILGISEEAFHRLKFFCGEINDYQTTGRQEQTAGDDVIALDLITDNKKPKVDFAFEEQVEEESEAKGTVEATVDQFEATGPVLDKNSLRDLLVEAGLSQDLAASLEPRLVAILGLPDEIEVQNALFELEGGLAADLLGQIYQKRHELYFAIRLDSLRGSPSDLATELARAREVQNASPDLLNLIAAYETLGGSGSALGEFSAGNARSTLESLSLAEMARMPKRLIPLKPRQTEYLSFGGGPLKLPKNSVRVTQNGYEEVRIPHQAALDTNETLKRITDIPEYFQDAFGDLKTFNRVQSRVFDFALRSRKNMLVCAPTGAGKTIVSMLAILGLVDSFRNPQTQLIDLSRFKVVYLAPMKALVAEIVATLNFRLNFLGMRAAEFTGDIHLSRQEFEDAAIIVSTPEKWDVLSRKTVERQFSDKLRLLIVDEIHLLGDSRGPVLESVIARTLGQEGVRVVGLSATLPNYTDVASFMGITGQEGLFYFNNSYRPVPLTQIYIGVNEGSGVKKAGVVRDVLFRSVLDRVKDHQMLVFVHSRKETVKTAGEIKETAFAENVEELFVSENSKRVIEGLKATVVNADLAALLPAGIGFHHAGLSRSDRKLVEDLFASGHLTVLVSTATLAWGVNLPAHTVIIKNTQVYSPQDGKWVPLSGQNLLQMLGRAGRPGFDTDGEGIIITSGQELRHYIAFLNEQEPIESGLLSSLPEAINAEVVLGNIQTIREAVLWLSNTFFFQRLRKNPKWYGLAEAVRSGEKSLVTFLIDAVHTAASELETVGLVQYHREKGTLHSTPEGRIASFFYLKPENVRLYKAGLDSDLNEIDLLKLFSGSVEFRNIGIREEEKVELSGLYTTVPIPVKGPLDDPKSKVNILLQCFISRVDLEGYALNCDLKFVSENSQRIFRALLELALQSRRGCCQLVLDFCKAIERRCWKELSPLRQFDGVGFRAIQRLEQQEHLGFVHFRNMSVGQLNNIIRSEPMSERVHSLIHKVPQLDTSVFVQVIARDLVKVSLHCVPKFTWDTALHGGRLLFRVFVMDVDQEVLLHHQPFFLFRAECTRFREEKLVEFSLKVPEPLPSHVFLKIASDEWLGNDNLVPVSLKGAFLPEKQPPFLELPDEVEVPRTHQFLAEWGPTLRLQAFTDLQTALFSSFYDTLESLFVSAARGSGKLTMAMVALIRLFEEAPHSKAVILLPTDWQVAAWEARLSTLASALRISLQKTTGVLQSDIQVLASGSLILSTVKDFEKLTRNYKKRPQLKELRLVVAADLFSFDDPDSTYEILLTRLRILFSHTKQLTRLIVTATPLANAKSVCDWLQIKKEFMFNFSPALTNNVLAVHFHSVDAIQAANFVEICAKKVVSQWALMSGTEGGWVVAVDSVNQGRSFATLLVREIAKAKLDLGLNPSRSALLSKAQQSFEDLFNSNLLEFGVAYAYPSTTFDEKKALEMLFRLGALRVAVITKDLLGSLSFANVGGVILVDGFSFSAADLSLVTGLLNQVDLQSQAVSGMTLERPNRSLLVYLKEWEKEEFSHRLLNAQVVESNLGLNFIEALNTQVASEAVGTKEQVLYWLTWTFFYRRLAANPNYYNLSSDDPSEVNDYISELVDSGVAQLVDSKCAVAEGQEVSADSDGTVASFYDLKVSTVELINGSFGDSFGWRTLLQVLATATASASAYSNAAEFAYLEELNERVPLKVPQAEIYFGFFRSFVLIQAYCARLELLSDYEVELQRSILPRCLTVLNGLIAMASPRQFLVPALLAVKMNKMLVQRMWHSDNTLKQLPYFTDAIVAKAAELGVENLDDFLAMDDEPREILLQPFPLWQKRQIAASANSFPNVQIEAALTSPEAPSTTGAPISITVHITQELLETEATPPEVSTTGLVKERVPSWWLFVADRPKNLLFLAKRVSFGEELTKDFALAVTDPGAYSLSVMLLSDAYVGFDVEAAQMDIKVEDASPNAAQ